MPPAISSETLTLLADQRLFRSTLRIYIYTTSAQFALSELVHSSTHSWLSIKHSLINQIHQSLAIVPFFLYSSTSSLPFYLLRVHLSILLKYSIYSICPAGPLFFPGAV